MADRCNVHRGCGGRYRGTTDFLGISDTDVNRTRYPDRNLPCDEHVAGVGGRTLDCVCKERDGRGIGGIGLDDGRCYDTRVGGIADRRCGRRGLRDSCLCGFIRCICGGRRRRRDRYC